MGEFRQQNHLLLLTMVMLGAWTIGTCRAGAGVADCFPVIGNERQVTVDATTGRTLVFLTSDEYIDTHYYPHSQTWAENGRYLLVESIRPRPDGTHPHPDETQLLAADTQTGQLYWLATLEVEDVEPYGDAHISGSRDYHADYSCGTNSIVFQDATSHHLYLLDLDTGQQRHLWHVTDGRLGSMPSISRDGSRVLVYVMYTGPLNDLLFDGRTSVVYAFDINPANNEVVRGPYVVYSFNERKAPPDINGAGTYIRLNHIQLNPAHPNLMSFCHAFTGWSDGSVDKTRLWYGRTDGTMVKMLTPTPTDRGHNHEVWGPLGQYLYYVEISKNSGRLRRVDVETGVDEAMTGNIEPRCLHMSVSGDEMRLVYDTASRDAVDADDNRMEWIRLYDCATGQLTNLARQMVNLEHPRHAHPQITEDGDKVAFCVATGPTSRVAYVTIE